MMLCSALLLFGAIGAGCRDDDHGAVTLEEYFERVEELDSELRTASDRIDAELEELDENDVDGVIESFDRGIDISEGFAGDMDDLNPPAEVAELHDETVASMRVKVEAFRSVLDEGRDAETVEELLAAFYQGADYSAIETVSDNCRGLQQVAADSNIEVEFACDDW